MFKFFVQAQTMSELKEKLVIAANSISVDITASQLASAEELHSFLDEGFPPLEVPPPVVDFRKTTPVFTAPPPIEAEIEELEEVEEEPVREVDSRGVPWNEKIHASSRAVNSDGTWRSRRGVDPKTTKEIEDSLPKYTPPPVAPPAEKPAPVVTTPKTYDMFPIPDAARPAHTFETFRAQFIPTLSTLVSTGKLTQLYVEELKKYFKVKEIWSVASNEEQCREMFETFCSTGLITKVG